ncbi:hypothetical protein QUH73_18860 [Labilibaculum sp. K2S]|uniref:hypothetical protein n=1 Tax=Labilibaculum sp. K2S TaxID=3056386 RepID=UPI0025A4874C|nr:hypothetical protein [Labilibaculum sp. K2S]MDM8161885.1 hypothetical protein [Labilibaculum sp. K2S]
MKVVIIFCVSAFYNDLKKIYRNSGVETYSEFDVKGFTRKYDKDGAATNWFASSKEYYDSIATFTFLEEEKGSALLNQISKFNQELECCSPMHAYMLDVEKFI